MQHAPTPGVSRILKIKAHWGDLLLSGRKKIEVRGSPAPIHCVQTTTYLSFSGAHFIRGAIWIGSCEGPVSVQRFQETRDLHLCGDNELPYENTYLWHIDNAAATEMIRHQHRRGAIIWIVYHPVDVTPPAKAVDVSTSVPELSSLKVLHRKELSTNRLAESGIYNLNDVSRLVLLRGVFCIPPQIAEQAFTWMEDERNVPKTPNPLNRNTFVLRRQCTFGHNYSFGQDMTTIPHPKENWPVAVQCALSMARAIAMQLGHNPDSYNGVHANLYIGPNASVQPHTDDEPDMAREMPIISFTILGGRKMARDFQVYEMDGTTKVAEIQLNDGDVVVMDGKMQQQFKHAVDKVRLRRHPDPQPIAPIDFTESKRINFTARAFLSVE